MGLIFKAGCDSCEFSRDEMRLGATHAEIAVHDVNTLELFAAPCCKTLQSVRVLMGHPYPVTPCEGCDRPLPLDAEHRYRVSTLKGEVLAGHRCPACGENTLTFERTGSFR